MTPSQRIVVNTAAQYTRTIINVCLSLYSTRLILAALGQIDYGIYSVVAGIVSMLSFITNALVVTTQRYLSFNHGKGDKKKVFQIFGNSLLLHILIAVILTITLAAITYPVMHNLLHIEPERTIAGIWVYEAAIIMLCLTFITAPFRALFIARENIVYISIIDILDGIFKLLIAIFITYITHYDRLISYAFLLIGISLFNLVAFAGYAFIHFEECHLPRIHEWDKQYIKDLSGFAGWTIYSTGCILARTQGVAIILNRIFGSVINAAYGISLQVSGAVHFLAQSVMSAMSPQIMKAEGAGDRKHMLLLAESASKYATLLLALAAIPLIAEMPTILAVWLKEVPEHAVMFCRFVLIASVCDQITVGLGTANQAIGKIRNYSLAVNTIKVLTLPVAWLCLYFGLSVEAVMWSYAGIELICALTRLPFLKLTAGLHIGHFVLNVFVRSSIPISIMIITSYCIISMINIHYRFILTFIITAFIGILAIWFTALTKQEQHILKNILLRKFKK